ncbi:MAG: hypothetical protein Q8R28_10570 [Dehalococcoidia bacterium]|nr:hypothetical protein [Dehalococcoidia bacterium]
MPLPAAEAIWKVMDGCREGVVGRSPGFGKQTFRVVIGKRRIERKPDFTGWGLPFSR